MVLLIIWKHLLCCYKLWIPCQSQHWGYSISAATSLDIAMALTSSPKLLLLDEPTSGVSAEEKFPMMETIMAGLGQEQSTTVLFVEHDMEIVSRYASRVVAFYSGRIIADDKPEVALATDDVRRYVTGELLSD